MLPVLIPEYFCLVSGVGVHDEDKGAQHLASRQAGVHDLNIQKVTSVLAPGCQECDINFVRKQAQAGRIIYAIDAKCVTSIEGQIVSAGIAVTIPDDRQLTGFFSEIYEHPGILPEHLKRRVEKGSLFIFADVSCNLYLDTDSVWEDGKDSYQIGGKNVRIKRAVESGVGPGKGKYICVYVGAILL